MTVELLANGTKAATLTLTAENDWSGTFDNLAKRDEAGKDIAYTVRELDVAGYAAEITGSAAEGYTITNTAATGTLTVVKTWDDANDADGIRPSAQDFASGLTLLANGEALAATPTAATVGNVTTITYKNLPIYANGKLITYAVEESVPAGYAQTVAPKAQKMSQSAGAWTAEISLTNAHVGDITVETGGSAATDAFFEKLVSAFPEGVTEKTFTFALAAEGDAPSPTQPVAKVTVNSANKAFAINFGTITFTDDDLAGAASKTFTYRLVEQKEAGWADNVATTDGLTIEVTLTKNADGTLSASWKKQAITNVYAADEQSSSPTGEGQLTLTKKLVGDLALKEGMFSFKLEGLPATADLSTKDASGQYFAVNGIAAEDNTAAIKFCGIGFAEPGTYAFELTELAGDIPGVTYDTDARTLVCMVTDADADGSFEFAWKLAEGKSVFTNTYKAVSATAEPLPATKELVVASGSDRALEAGEFDFAILGGENVSVTGTNVAGKANAPAKITWDDLTFTTDDLIDEAGNYVTSRTFTFAVFELAGDDATIAYDGNVYKRSLTLAWADGKLTATWNDSDPVAFENVFEPAGTPSSPTGKGGITIAKAIEDADNQGRTPKANEFLFRIAGTVGDREVVLLGTNDDKGRVSFPNIWFGEAGTYTFTVSELAGNDPTIASYDTRNYTLTATVADDGTGELAVAWALEGSSAKSITFTNVTKKSEVSLEVMKVWAGDTDENGEALEARPASVTLVLTAATATTEARAVRSIELNSANDWRATVSGLAKYDANGDEIAYALTEPSVPAGYTAEFAKVGGAYVVVNTYEPEAETITVSYVDPSKPEGEQTILIETIVRGDNEPAAPEDPTREGYVFGGWRREVEPGTDNVIYIAQWIELPAPDPEKTTVFVYKAWNDANDQDGVRPDHVTVELVANGARTGVMAELKEENNWLAVFSKLPVADDSGNAIVYTVVENDVPEGYASEVSGSVETGFKLVNTYVPLATTVTATKAWADEPESVGESLRADAVLHLFGLVDGRVVFDAGEKVVAKDATGDDAKVSWNVPAYQGGEKLTWVIAEEPMAGYTSDFTWDENGRDCVVTNSYVGTTTSVTINKTWNDGDDIDGKRPDEVSFQLLRRVGDVVEPVGEPIVLTADGGWTATVEDLPATVWVGEGDEAVEAIAYYSVVELDEDGALEEAGYMSCVSALEPGVFEATNIRLERDTTSVTVSKQWADDDDADGIRPAYINVVVSDAAGEAVATLTLTAANNWSATVSGLAKNSAKGVEAVYVVGETDVPAGYVASTTGSVDDGFVVINTHESASPLTLVVTKVWAGDEDDTSARQDVTLHLYKVVEGYGPIEVEGAAKTIPADATGDELTVTWTNLPSVEDGRSVTYTVREDAVEGYNGSQTDGAISGQVITITVTNTKAREPEPEYINVRYIDRDETILSEDIVRGTSEPIQPVDPEREGYIFGGWSRSEDANGNVTYEARWIELPKPGEIVVTYVDGIGNTIQSDVITRGDNEPVQPAAPERDGYLFGGWLREMDENGNVTYTANWIEIPGVVVVENVLVTYIDPKGETLILSATQFETQEAADTEAETLAGAPADPEHEGYIFTGWLVSQDEYGNYIITATYNEAEPEPGKIAVSYVDGQAEDALVKSELVESADEVEAPENPSHEGMTFVGWKETVDAAGNVIFVAEYASDCKNPTEPDTPDTPEQKDDPTPSGQGGGNGGGAPSGGNASGGGQPQGGSVPKTGDESADVPVAVVVAGGVLVVGCGALIWKHRRDRDAA